MQWDMLTSNNYMYTVCMTADRRYRRSGFECEILLIANCEFLHKTQSKELQEKEYAMNNATRDHTPLVCVLACDPKSAHVNRIIDITRARSTCMLVRTAVDRQG